MAGFKAHITFGALSAVILTVYVSTLVFAPVELLPLVFFLTLFSSMLPDIDSDSGLPVRIIFAILSISAVIATYNYFDFKAYNNTKFLLMSTGSGIFTYFIVRFIFNKFISHRGVFHSIPMSVI